MLDDHNLSLIFPESPQLGVDHFSLGLEMIRLSRQQRVGIPVEASNFYKFVRKISTPQILVNIETLTYNTHHKRLSSFLFND